jgi:hypothetical protein
VEVSGGTLGKEGLGALVSGTQDTVRERELDLVAVELLGRNTDAILGSKLLHIDDLDGGETGTVTASHILVQLGDGTRAAGVTELLVHVVSEGSRVVTQPDTVVANAIGALNILFEKHDP